MANTRGHRGRVDLNQSEIVDGLRKCGMSVQILASVGEGCPDLLVGFQERNILLEIKQPGQKMNAQETNWHAKWSGQRVVVHTFPEAYEQVLAHVFDAVVTGKRR